MLTISNPMTAGQAADYYVGHGKEAYYLDELSQAGSWTGSAASQLELPRTVTRRVFRQLLEGFSPDGRRPLVQNAGDPRRDACWDLTFSAPKSVSVLWALSSPATRKEIERAHREAVFEALKYVEEVAGFTRRGKGGAIKEPADLLFATFFHGSSRAHDPAVHTHALLINLGLRRDGTTGALRTLEVFQCKMLAGQRYRDALARNLTQGLRLQLDPEKVGFHVRGVPRELCVACSQRSRSIRKLMQQRGLTGAVAAKFVTLLTRPKKERLSQQEFFSRCEAVGRQFGWGRREAQELVERGPRERAETQPAREAMTQEARTSERRATNEPTGQSTRPAGERVVRGEPRDRSQGQTAAPSLESQSKKGGRWQPAQRTAEATTAGVSEEQNRARPARGTGDARTEPLERPRSQRHRPEEEPVHCDPSRDERRGCEGRLGAAQSSRPEDRTRADCQRGQDATPPDVQARSEHAGRSQGDRAAGEESFRQRTDDRQPWERGQDSWPRATRNDRARDRQLDDRRAATARSGARDYRLRMEWRRLFPKAPFWSLAQFVKVPTIGFPKAQPRWSGVLWKGNLKFAELRVQRRRLFPDAPKWNPLQGFKLPALRVVRPAGSGREPPLPKWRGLRWKANLGLGELRIQNRQPFRRAPNWSPVRRLEIPALHLTQRQSKWTRAQAIARLSRPEPQLQQTRLVRTC